VRARAGGAGVVLAVCARGRRSGARGGVLAVACDVMHAYKKKFYKNIFFYFIKIFYNYKIFL
jgi:hypothetical protein